MRLHCLVFLVGMSFLPATALDGEWLGEGIAHVLDARVIGCEQPSLTNICLLPGAHTSEKSMRLTDFRTRTAPATPEWALSALGPGVVLKILVQARRQVQPSWVLGWEPLVTPWRHEQDSLEAVVLLREPYPRCPDLMKQSHVYLYNGGFEPCGSDSSDLDLAFDQEYFFTLLDAAAPECIGNP